MPECPTCGYYDRNQGYCVIEECCYVRIAPLVRLVCKECRHQFSMEGKCPNPDCTENKMNTPLTDRRATQLFLLTDLLASHCGEKLTAGLIDQLRGQFYKEIIDGPCAWAFKGDMEKGKYDRDNIPNDR